MAVMDGVDAIVFTAGIGENVPLIRSRLRRDLRKLLNKKVKFLTVHTNEEKLIAQDTFRLVSEKK